MQPEIRQNQTDKRKVMQRLLEGLYRRPFRKLAALLLAIVFWAVVIASDPTLPIEKTITGGVVEVRGAEVLRNRGLTVTTDLTSRPIEVKMRVEVKQANYDSATAESFAPKLELSQQISAAGRQQVKISAANTMLGKVLSIEPEFIEVDVEPYTARKIVPVIVEQTGESEDALWNGKPRVDPSQVVLSGPKSQVDRVKRAVAYLDRSSLSKQRPSDTMTELIQLQDENGKQVKTGLLNVTSDSVSIDSVTIEVDVYPTRELPVLLGTAVLGIPAHGYALSDVRITPETILVAADQETLDSLAALHVSDPIDITDSKGSVVESAGLRGLTDLRFVSASEVLIEADVVPAEHVHTYQGMSVAVMGAAPNLRAALDHPSMRCVLSGDYGDVEGLTAADIQLYVDASGLQAGQHVLPVQCVIDGTEAFRVMLEWPEITLTLTQ